MYTSPSDGSFGKLSVISIKGATAVYMAEPLLHKAHSLMQRRKEEIEQSIFNCYDKNKRGGQGSPGGMQSQTGVWQSCSCAPFPPLGIESVFLWFLGGLPVNSPQFAAPPALLRPEEFPIPHLADDHTKP